MTSKTDPRRTRDCCYETFRAEHPDFIIELEGLRQFEKLALGKLSSLNARGRRAYVRTLLHCPRLATLNAYEVIRNLQQLHGVTPASIRALATRCNPYSPIRERIRTTTVVKHGRPRIVQNFGPERRLHHRLVAKVLAQLHPPRPEQFLFNGGDAGGPRGHRSSLP
ncbi:hypothetical protein NUH86_16795 [Sphingobium sp. JS3065]|uniref:hypothetical protein n=1 Tax=Sphingobium sp. JS3065 TaxID=2970925 RepID=UPI002263D50A|nr:hypothetical protein [Sphingobium sp. JS3065]UZW55106.1 hypothetical protein NUH86_16795 [Sphingobium sp. JS3065]